MTLRSRSWVIDFNRCSGKAQVRRATLSCDSSYYFNDLIKFGQMSLYFLAIIGLLYPFLDKHLDEPYRYQGEWSSVMRCVAVFVGINHASAVSFTENVVVHDHIKWSFYRSVTC